MSEFVIIKPKDVQKINCPLCGSNKHKMVRTNHNLRIVKCSCGLCFVNPQPTKKFLFKWYNESFYYNPTSEENITRNNRGNEVHKEVVKIITSFKRGGKILDIGCGPGALLTYFDKKRYSLAGTEYSDLEISKAKKITRDIFKGDYLEITLHKKFDIITMVEVLEHTQKPLDYLKKIYTNLNVDGLAVITVPNNDWMLMKGYMNDLTTMHLFYFNKKTMTESLRKIGFRDIRFHINVKANYYENWYKTLVIQVNQLFSFILFRLTGLYKGSGIIVSARK